MKLDANDDDIDNNKSHLISVEKSCHLYDDYDDDGDDGDDDDDIDDGNIDADEEGGSRAAAPIEVP